MSKAIILLFLLVSLVLGFSAPALAQTAETRIPVAVIVQGEQTQGVTVVVNGAVQTFSCPNPQPYITVNQSSSGWACYDQSSGTWLLQALPPQSNAGYTPATSYSYYGYPYPYSYYSYYYPYSYPYSYYPYYYGPAFGFGFGFGHGYYGYRHGYYGYGNHYYGAGHYYGGRAYAGAVHGPARGFVGHGGGFAHAGGGFAHAGGGHMGGGRR
jgi:hypothetical protein